VLDVVGEPQYAPVGHREQVLYGSNEPTNSVKALKEDKSPKY